MNDLVQQNPLPPMVQAPTADDYYKMSEEKSSAPVESKDVHPSESSTKGIPSFNETMDQFLILAEKVLQYDTSGELIIRNSGQASGIQVALNGYKTIYNRTRELPGHVNRMRDVYMKCRPLFIRDTPLDDFMEWFGEKSSFVISPQEKSRNKLYLTSIFRNCTRIASHIAEEAKRNPDKADELFSNPAAVYPEYFTLYLLRMFYHCADPSDRETLISPRIKELEKILNLAQDEAPIIDDSLSELMSMAGDIASEMGIEVPKNARGFNGSQLKKALSEWTKNSDMRNTVKSFFAGVDLKNTRDLPGAISKVLGKMQETAQTIPEPVQRSLTATADSAEGYTLPKQ